MTKLTKDEIAALDASILKMIAEHPKIHGGARLMDIASDRAVLLQIGKLPSGKPGLRYIDGALQRLRRAGEIRTNPAATNRWIRTRR